jgi:hypothetical protein
LANSPPEPESAVTPCTHYGGLPCERPRSRRPVLESLRTTCGVIRQEFWLSILPHLGKQLLLCLKPILHIAPLHLPAGFVDLASAFRNLFVCRGSGVFGFLDHKNRLLTMWPAEPSLTCLRLGTQGHLRSPSTFLSVQANGRSELLTMGSRPHWL